MKKTSFLGYLVAVHVALFALVIKTDLLQRTAARLGVADSPDAPEISWQRSAQDRLDDSVPAGATIFLGDSHTQFLPVGAVTPVAVNYGIGRQRSDQLMESMKVYGALKRARAVILMIGTNDIVQGREEGIGLRYRDMLAMVPNDVRTFLVSIPPMADADAETKVENVNAQARSVCASDSHCTFVDGWAALTENGAPRPEFLREDGIHLTPAGYSALIERLRDALSSDQSNEQ